MKTNSKFSDNDEDDSLSSSSSSDFGSDDDDDINIKNNIANINNSINNNNNNITTNNNNNINNNNNKNKIYNQKLNEDDDDDSEDDSEDIDIGNENNKINVGNDNNEDDEEFFDDEDDEPLEDDEDESGGMDEDGEMEDDDSSVNRTTSRQKDIKRGGAKLNQRLLAPIPQDVKKKKILTDEMKQKKSEVALFRRNKKIEEDEAQMRDVVNQLFYRKAATKEISKEEEKKPSRHDLFIKQQKGNTICYSNDYDNGSCISYPKGHIMINQIEIDKNRAKSNENIKFIPPIKCSAVGCNNVKRYNCPKNNLPVCTFECWQKVINNHDNITTK